MRIGCSLLILALALANPLQSTSALPTTSCAATACVYLPSVQYTGDVYVVEKGYDAVRGIFGNIWGELTASSPVTNVVIEAHVYDQYTQELVRFASASPILTATLPGQLNPFYLAIPSPISLKEPAL